MLSQAKFVLKGLIVKPENMERNLKISQGLIMAETIMLALSKKTEKKETGFSLVHASAMGAFEKGVPFDKFIQNSPKFQKYFSKAEIQELLDPKNYLGLTDRLINDVIGGK